MISKDIQEELRKRFNPDGSVLRRQQLLMLEILDAVDAVCRKHNIPYWLSSGTLIGAVRHKGFIPWDDDVDIEMLKDDFDHLMKVLPDELPERFALQTHETDPNYFFTFAKVRDKTTHIEETLTYGRIFKEQGAYIDIFPMEHLPRAFDWIAGHLHGQIFNQLNNPSLSEQQQVKRVRSIYNFNIRYSFPVLRFLSRFIGNPKYLLPSFGTPHYGLRNRDEIFPLKEMEFEGRSFPVPYDTDAVLRRIYGDYTQLPDLENLKPHCNKIEFLNDNSTDGE